MNKQTPKQITNYFIYAVILIISFTVACIFLMHQQNAVPSFTPYRGDAGGYIAMSHYLSSAMKEGIRTYAYPLFLKLIRYPYSDSIESLQIFSFYILVIHYVLYATSVFFFAFSVTNSQTIRFLITATLLLQINVLTFLSVTLTEILSLSMLLISCGVFFGVKKGYPRAFLLGLCAAFSVEVRPANLWVYGLILIIFLFEFSYYKEAKNKIKFLKLIVLFLIGSLISLAPQIYFNYIHFHVISPLPAGDLMKIQHNVGKEHAFASFSLISGQSWVFTKNPFLITSSHEFHWLSINGFSYLLFKIMIMFHHTSLFVYQAVSEKYQTLMVLFSSFNVYFGLLGLKLQYKNIPYEQYRALFLGLFFCILLHLNSRPEDRYTFAICLLLIPFAVYQFLYFIRLRHYKYLFLFIPFFLFANLFNSLMQALSATPYSSPDIIH